MRGKEESRTTGAGTDIKNKAEELGTTALDKAKEAASTVADKARDAASAAGQKAEDATAAVGHGMRSLAGTIREHTPREGVLGTASSTVAKTLESGGRYLEQEGLSGVMDDLTNMVRRNPLPALLIGVGIGFLLARATTRR